VATGILKNEIYIGKLVWNHLRYIKDPATGKRRSRLNPEKDWIIKEVPELRIAAQELVKARQAATTRDMRPDARAKDFWERQRPGYLLSGLMKCGCCSAAMAATGLAARRRVTGRPALIT
jgi:hypothetical protein